MLSTQDERITDRLNLDNPRVQYILYVIYYTLYVIYIMYYSSF